MDLDVTFQEAKTQWAQWLAYERDSDTYNICVFVDADSTCGFLDKSDVICVFEDKTGDLVSLTERVSKKDFNIFQRWAILRTGKRISKSRNDYEVFINKRGEFIEFQLYKRWWYDIARDVGHLSHNMFHSTILQSGEDS